MEPMGQWEHQLEKNPVTKENVSGQEWGQTLNAAGLEKTERYVGWSN